MKVKIELSNILKPSKKEVHVFDNYDEKFMPPKPKGQLSFDKMFGYWSKIFREQKGINYPPSYFDMTKNIGIVFNIKAI